MRLVEETAKDEVIQDTTDADRVARAKERMGLCVMPASEQSRYAYAPGEARDNNNPAYPMSDYGEDTNG